MKILLTGANGYIGSRLLPVLAAKGHEVVCCVRDTSKFKPAEWLKNKVSVLKIDLLDQASLQNIPKDIDAAYYLVHSMSDSKNYGKLEEQAAVNFRKAMQQTLASHVIYLGAIVNENSLSEHFQSRKNVENELRKGTYHFTSLRSGIIIGPGSASFEIIRDLVEKLPLMVAPRWLKTRCQPIDISDVIEILSKALMNEETFDKSFDIGGSDILNYKEMLMGYAKSRNLKRKIWTVPVMTPNLSSYWLYFVTSTSYRLARTLVDSMAVEVVCKDDAINQILSLKPMGYAAALDSAFARVEPHLVAKGIDSRELATFGHHRPPENDIVPVHGCYVDKRELKFSNREACVDKVWNIGGDNGWYYINWLWQLRGLLDKLIGGVGMRRGSRVKDCINEGDKLDFWRVLNAKRQTGHLLLFAEMKLPGEAWLEFKMEDDMLVQKATFRPLGVAGRLYWFFMYPFHVLIFRGLIKKIAKADKILGQKKQKSINV